MRGTDQQIGQLSHRERHVLSRRALRNGALVGLALGVIAQLFVPWLADGGPDYLIRIALMLPGAWFALWWFIDPRRAERGDGVSGDGSRQLDVDAKLARIEAAFDDVAVPRAGSLGVTQGDEDDAAAFRQTIRRASGDAHNPSTGNDPSAATSSSSFGVSRPPRPPRA